jgi:hypothetical protein
MQLHCSVDHGYWQGLIEGVRRSNKEVVRIIINLVYVWLQMGVQVLAMVYQCWLWRRRPKPCWFARITSVQCNFKQSNARSKEKRSKSITYQKKQCKMLWEQKCMEAGRGRGEPDDPSRVLEERSWTCSCGRAPCLPCILKATVYSRRSVYWEGGERRKVYEHWASGLRKTCRVQSSRAN